MAYIKADYRGYREVSCVLFDGARPTTLPHDPLAFTYKVSVSNNEEHYSPDLTLMVYHGKCMECDPTTQKCVRKVSTIVL